MVMVLVAAVVPEIVTGDVAAQVGALVGLLIEVVTAHVSVTAPVNPPTGLTVIVDVLPLGAPPARLSCDGAAPSVTPGTGGVVVTVIVSGVLAVIWLVAASLPVTVAV